MNRDPCMFPQLRSKKRERDDWFLIQIGCFNSDTEKEKSSGGSTKDSPLGFDDDEAADYQDRVDEAMKQARDRGDDTDELEDYFDRTEFREPTLSPADRGKRDPIDIAKIAGIREFDPTPFPGADTPGGPVSQSEPERVPGKKGTVTVAGAPFVSGGRSSELAYQQALGKAIGETPRIEESSPSTGALFGDADTDIFESDLIKEAQAQGMAQYGFNPAQQQIQAARGRQRTSDQTAQSIAKAAPTPERVQEDVPPSIRTMRGPTFSSGPEDEFEQFDETDYLDLGKIGPAPPEGEEDNRASDSLVERRERGIAAAKAAAAENPLIQSPDLTGLQVGDVTIPLGPAGMLAQGIGAIGTDIFNTFANPTAKALDNIQNKGHSAIYGAEGNLIGSVNPESGNVQPTEGNAFNPELSSYFNDLRQRRKDRRDSDDGGPQPISPFAGQAQAQAPVPVVPETYVGQQVVQPYQYTPASPVQFSYTGLPTLAPTMLRPTFQAQQSFSPLFNLGQTRRS